MEIFMITEQNVTKPREIETWQCIKFEPVIFPRCIILVHQQYILHVYFQVLWFCDEMLIFIEKMKNKFKKLFLKLILLFILQQFLTTLVYETNKRIDYVVVSPGGTPIMELPRI